MFAAFTSHLFITSLLRTNRVIQINKQKVTIKLPIQNITWFCWNQWLDSGESFSFFSVLCITLLTDICCTKKRFAFAFDSLFRRRKCRKTSQWVLFSTLIYRLIMMLLEFKSLSTVTSESETWVNTCVRLIACQSFTNRLSLGAWIDFTWRHQFQYPKLTSHESFLLSSSQGRWRCEFLSVYNLSIQWCLACKPAQSYGPVVHDIPLRSRLWKNIHLSSDSLVFLEIKVLGKLSACVNVCCLSSDNQSPRQPKWDPDVYTSLRLVEHKAPPTWQRHSF